MTSPYLCAIPAVLLLQFVFGLPAPQQGRDDDLEERYGFRNFPPNNRFIPNGIPNNFPSRPWPQRGGPQRGSPHRGSNNNHLNNNDNFPNDDIFIFDRPLATRKPPARPRTTTTTQAPIGGTTRANCDCPSTAEFNPVCGTDRTTYSNPGKLRCAKLCGKSVGINHYGNCITTTTSTTTPRTSG